MRRLIGLSSILLNGCFQVSPSNAVVLSAHPVGGPSNVPAVIIRFPNDTGQVAETIVTVNGSSSTKLVAEPGVTNHWSVAARALNFPYRKIVVTHAELYPQLPTSTIIYNSDDTAEVDVIAAPNEVAAGTLRVSIRDMTACELRPIAAEECAKVDTEIPAVDRSQTFTWSIAPAANTALVKNNGPSATLGSGIGSLSELVSSGVKSRAFAGGLAAAVAQATNGGFSGGASYAYAVGINLGLGSEGYFGAYPGYGFDGLSCGNIYGGFYDDAGSGFGSAVNDSYSFNASGWSTGITTNSYYSRSVDDFKVDAQNTVELFGSAAYYQVSPGADGGYHYLSSRVDPSSVGGSAWFAH